MLEWLTFRALGYIAGGLAALSLGLALALWFQGVEIGYLENERDKAKNELAAARVQLEDARKTIEGYRLAVDQCNAATAKLKAVSEEKAVKAANEVAKAREEARRYQNATKQRAALLAGPTPSGAGCREAVAEVRRDLQK